MPRAFNSLSSRNKSFKPVGTHTIAILARLAAKNAVKDQLRADGVRVSLVPPREITEKAKAYLDANPHLFEEAYSRAWRMRLIEQAEPAPVCEIQWIDQDGNTRSCLMSLKYTSGNVRHWRPLKTTCLCIR